VPANDILCLRGTKKDVAKAKFCSSSDLDKRRGELLFAYQICFVFESNKF
jgi:hypothetical protein